MKVLATIFGSIGLFAASLIPWLLLVEAEHLTPAWLRATPAATTHLLRALPLTGAALLLILGGTHV